MPFIATKEIRINELLLNCPAAMEVLLNHGFHCVGCGLSAFETLEEGAKAHGYTDGEVDRIVVEINDAGREFEKKIAASENEESLKLAKEREAAAKVAAEKAEDIWLGRAKPEKKPSEAKDRVRGKSSEKKKVKKK